MKTRLLNFIALALLPCWVTTADADSFGSGDNTFDIEFVTIGNPGNPADTTGAPNPAGAVDYIYNIGKFEVSREMIEKASVEGGLGLTLDAMDFITGGPHPDMPATGISWNEAARFVNWMNESEGFSPAYKFAMQPGDAVYDANADIELWVDGDSGFDAANPFRNSNAQYFLPSVHEWYKAAFYNPNANDGTGGYWDYPTGSDSVPTAVDSGTDSDTAVYFQTHAQGPADITHAGGLSPYGVMGLGGNVWEWEETALFLMNDDGSSVRGVRGGSWLTVDLSALLRNGGGPALEHFQNGFRVASIPEPSSIGDFNGDRLLDVADIDELTRRSASGTNPPDYDLNSDSLVNDNDVNVWVKDLFHSWIGDANLDKEFNSSDLVAVLAAGTYETNVNAVWSTGDFDGSGRFDSTDLIAALADGGYEQGPRAAVSAVPEPASFVILSIGLICIWTRRQHVGP